MKTDVILQGLISINAIATREGYKTQAWLGHFEAPAKFETTLRAGGDTFMAEVVHRLGRLREAVGVFDDAEALTAAVEELASSGFDRSEISLLAGETTIEQKLGHRLRSVTDAEDDPKIPTVAYVSPQTFGDIKGGLIGGLLYVGAIGAAGTVVATGGTLGALLLATSVTGAVGATIGSLAAAWIDKHHADYIAEQIDRGGPLLWVRAWDPDREKRATEILSRHSAHDVHVHELRPRS